MANGLIVCETPIVALFFSKATYVLNCATDDQLANYVKLEI